MRLQARNQNTRYKTYTPIIIVLYFSFFTFHKNLKHLCPSPNTTARSIFHWRSEQSRVHVVSKWQYSEAPPSRGLLFPKLDSLCFYFLWNLFCYLPEKSSFLVFFNSARYHKMPPKRWLIGWCYHDLRASQLASLSYRPHPKTPPKKQNNEGNIRQLTFSRLVKESNAQIENENPRKKLLYATTHAHTITHRLTSQPDSSSWHHSLDTHSTHKYYSTVVISAHSLSSCLMPFKKIYITQY